jgi:thiol:disulfide interchange protein
MPLLLAAAIVLCFLTGLVPGSAVSAQTPKVASAEVIVDEAVKRAKTEKNAVLIEFGASWCTWCRDFEQFVKSPDAGPVLASQFVVTNLTVRERDEKKGLENPGGNELMEKWGGAKSGLPFYVFLDASGNKVADSNAMPDGTNIGFPAIPAEINAFVGLMDKAAPRLTMTNRRILEAYLTRVMPKKQE